MVNKKSEIIRVYLPPDTNTLLATYDHVLRSRQLVNVVVAGKQPAPNFLNADAARRHTCHDLLGQRVVLALRCHDAPPDCLGYERGTISAQRLSRR